MPQMVDTPDTKKHYYNQNDLFIHLQSGIELDCVIGTSFPWSRGFIPAEKEGIFSKEHSLWIKRFFVPKELRNVEVDGKKMAYYLLFEIEKLFASKVKNICFSVYTDDKKEMDHTISFFQRNGYTSHLLTQENVGQVVIMNKQLGNST
jgi:hypothetical protein